MASLPAPDLTSGIEKRKIGGLGIFLIKKMVDEVKYRRERNFNILKLTMKRGGKKSDSNSLFLFFLVPSFVYGGGPPLKKQPSSPNGNPRPSLQASMWQKRKVSIRSTAST